MAGNKTLDPTSCTTASEAFKYPLPQIRQFHRSLTVELDEKNARLRTLVGGSYRQLLGTAEMILQMRDDIGIVEDRLGRVGKGCGRGVIGGMAGGLGKLQGKLNEGKVGDEMGWIAKAKVLDMCTVSVGRILRTGASLSTEFVKDGRGKNLVLAAKVLVLSRLLAKSLSDSGSTRSKVEIESVEETRRKLGSLRKRLLRAIEKTLEKTGGPDGREDLLKALCAYSLATSSGAKDVLRHFLHVRGEAMTLAFEDDADTKRETPGVLRALGYYTRTLLDVQTLAPRRLSEALAGLKVKPLLKDEQIRELEGLRLDICGRWFGDQISFFTPYIRHDDLEGSQTVETLRAWSRTASKVLLEGFGETLQRVVEFKTVVELRTKILELWIKDGGKAKGFDPSTILNGFRKVINDRMLELLKSRVSKLHLVGTEIEATLGAWRTGITDHHSVLWSDDILEMEINNGASSFKQGILTRTHGRNDAVLRAVNGYQTWRHLIDEIVTVLESLKKQRWDDDLEDIEDDLSIESRNTSLSKEDPKMLQDQLDSSLEEAYVDLQEKLTSLLAAYEDSENIGQISVYLLRVLRDIRSNLPKDSSYQGFGIQLVPSLHKTLAVITSENAVELFEKNQPLKRIVGRGLWEGDPELPVQPSPKIFKLLRGLSEAMADIGCDVWSPAAVTSLKQHLRSVLSGSWKKALMTLDKENSNKANGTKANGAAVNGDSDTPEIPENNVSATPKADDEDKRKEILIQSLFDIFVLQNSLESAKDAEDEIKALGTSVQSQTKLDLASHKRLQNGAREYWKRSSLLFSLLT
jgi:hypothetical protein